ncbi:Unknown protein, partial [Striga hermonthica]
GSRWHRTLIAGLGAGLGGLPTAFGLVPACCFSHVVTSGESPVHQLDDGGSWVLAGDDCYLIEKIPGVLARDQRGWSRLRSLWIIQEVWSHGFSQPR